MRKKCIFLDFLTFFEVKNASWVKKGVAPKNAPTYIDKSKLPQKEEAESAGKKYECQVCGHVYDPAAGDPDGGIDPGTAFEDIPEDWICPVCGTRKSDFTEIS